MLKYSSFSFSALTMLVGQSCCSLRPQTAKCVFFPSRKMFVWILRVFGITKSNLYHMLIWSFPLFCRGLASGSPHSLKHTLELSPLKDFNSQAQYLKSYPYFLSWALLSTVSSNFTKYCWIYFWNETWALWSSPSLNIWATFILLLNQAHSIFWNTSWAHHCKITLFKSYLDFHFPRHPHSTVHQLRCPEFISLGKNLGPLELSKF